MTRVIYFVRHGETTGNAKHVHQFPEMPLSLHGRVQARSTASALKGKGVQRIVSSDLLRARETADIIARELDVPVEYTEHLREVRRARHIWGRHHYSFFSLWALSLFFLSGLFGSRRVYDEETLAEFTTRIVDELNTLATYKEDVLLVVTHRGVMTELIPIARHGRISSWRAVLAFTLLYAVDNGEFTKLERSGDHWHILEKNSNAHLSEKS